MLAQIAMPDAQVVPPMMVRVVRLPFKGEVWDFAANVRGWAGVKESAYIPWVMRGVTMPSWVRRPHRLTAVRRLLVGPAVHLHADPSIGRV